ncbi:uncharacterized protein LOC143897092 [Temnothorax americanus]|uniref:uncharacterized protein LOC143897092 n=1 Tax=Temnothorax americanus TaxID=1964332 RepID=UPI0040676C1C
MENTQYFTTYDNAYWQQRVLTNIRKLYNLPETLNGFSPINPRINPQINLIYFERVETIDRKDKLFDSDHIGHGGSKSKRKEKYQTVVEEEKEEDRENKKAARKGLEKRFCEICRKKFSCQKQYDNHLASKAHKKKNIIRCLFCDERNQSLEYIMEHMAKSHSFVIDDSKYCVNPKRLLLHLAKKVYFHFQCISCCDSEKKWKNYNAARMHMIAEGHCEIKFYDYFNFYIYDNYPDDETAEPEELPKVHEANCELLESSDVNKAKQPLTPGRFMNSALFHKIKRYKQDLETKRKLRNSIKKASFLRPTSIRELESRTRTNLAISSIVDTGLRWTTFTVPERVKSQPCPS